jgi:hypothetical protein
VENGWGKIILRVEWRNKRGGKVIKETEGWKMK